MINGCPTVVQLFSHFREKLNTCEGMSLNPLQGFRFFILNGKTSTQNWRYLLIVIWLHKNAEWIIFASSTWVNRWKLKQYKRFILYNIFVFLFWHSLKIWVTNNFKPSVLKANLLKCSPSDFRYTYYALLDIQNQDSEILPYPLIVKYLPPANTTGFLVLSGSKIFTISQHKIRFGILLNGSLF